MAAKLQWARKESFMCVAQQFSVVISTSLISLRPVWQQMDGSKPVGASSFSSLSARLTHYFSQSIIGDIGCEDEQGNLFITDRSKDLIKFKGYQVAPAELEDIILENEAVGDATVIGIMNESLASEVPLAYVVVKSGYPQNQTTAQAILKHVNDRTVSYKHLRGGIIFTEVIPRSNSGKVLKRLLRDRVSVDLVRRIGAKEYTKYMLVPKL